MELAEDLIIIIIKKKTQGNEGTKCGESPNDATSHPT
jgi:hypothetical protein